MDGATRRTVGIFGTGGRGNETTRARAPGTHGGKTVLAIDLLESRREQAMEFGATQRVRGPRRGPEKPSSLTRGDSSQPANGDPHFGAMRHGVVKAAVNCPDKAGPIRQSPAVATRHEACPRASSRLPRRNAGHRCRRGHTLYETR